MGNGHTKSAEEMRDEILAEVFEDLKNTGAAVCIELPDTSSWEPIVDSLEDNPLLQCLVCRANKAYYVSLPCGHRWLCGACLSRFSEDPIATCPKCDRVISSIK